MSAPRIIIQILVTGTRIFGKALYEAGRQAAKNAKTRPEALGNDISGVRNATSSSITDKLTREHRMTLDEAHLILNVRKGEPMENLIKNYNHLFKANSPPPPLEKGAAPSPGNTTPFYSHYLQSKVLRARDRIESELKQTVEGSPAEGVPHLSGSNPPPPPPPGNSS